MTLAADYQTFLRTANPELLAPEAQLHYVSTVTTFSRQDPIAKHLQSQARVLKKKEEAVIGSFESASAVCLDVETTIQFVTGGGTYLPGLEDYLVADRTVTIPITHIVRFDANGKIEQIRQQWDQASLLRAVDVIGSRGKNWPIKDGKEQVRLIKSSTADASSAADEISRTMASTTLAATKSPHPTNDPYTTLHNELYAPRHEKESSHSREVSLPPRGTRRPPTREWDELFPGANPEQSPVRAASPTKGYRVAPKVGAGKNFAPSRIFDTEHPEPMESGDGIKSPEGVRPHPNKYQHFEFHDGHNDPAPTPSHPRPKTKHQSNWDFSDFTTPAKVKQRQHAQSNPQFQIGETGDTSPRKPRLRPDSVTHFELQDDGQKPADHRPKHPRGPGHTSISHSLYNDHTLQDSGQYSVDKNEVFRDIKNVNQQDRRKDFAPHFAMEDDPETTPVGGHGSLMKPTTTNTSLKDRSKDFGKHYEITDQPGLEERSANDANRPLSGNKAKAINTITSTWEPSDVSPAGAKHKANPSGDWGPLGGNTGSRENQGINIAGDGMGSRKSAGGKENEKEKGINIGGDGMGGRKDAGRSWAFDQLDKPDNGPKPKVATKGGAGPSYRSSLWDQ